MAADLPVQPDAACPESAFGGAAVPAQAALLQLLADNVPVLIAYYSAHDLRCRFANQQYAETFGRDVRSTVGSTLEEVVGADAAREIGPQVERMLALREPVVYERTLCGAVRRWMEVHLLPHLDAGTGAAIGGIAGGGRGAAIGALVGGGAGALGGAATTPNRPTTYYEQPSYPQPAYQPAPQYYHPRPYGY